MTWPESPIRQRQHEKEVLDDVAVPANEAGERGVGSDPPTIHLSQNELRGLAELFVVLDGWDREYSDCASDENGATEESSATPICAEFGGIEGGHGLPAVEDGGRGASVTGPPENLACITIG